MSEERIEEIYKTRRVTFVRFALRYVRSVPDAEEVVQEAFLRDLEHGAPPRNESWYFDTIRGIALDRLRRRAVRQRIAAEVSLEEAAVVSVPDFVESVETRLIIAVALSLLPQLHRECVLLKAQGFKVHEVATTKKISEAKVKRLWMETPALARGEPPYRALYERTRARRMA